MSLLVLFIRKYPVFFLVLYLSSITAEVYAQAAPDFFAMDELLTKNPLEAITEANFKEKPPCTDPNFTEDNFEEAKPTTDSNVFCGSPPSIMYGEPKEEFTTQDVFSVGSVVSYQCKTNYEYIPDTVNMAKCESDGQWSLPEKFCKPKVCFFLPRMNHAQPKDPFLGQTIFSFGERIPYNCRPGYLRAPGIQTYATCLNDGTWSLPGNFCKRKSCGNPGDVENAEMTAEDFLFGSRVTYSCNPGYRMISKKNYIECQADGTWSNNLPICEATICPPPPEITNGIVHPIKEEYSYLDSVTYRCNRNLALMGESSVSCKDNGQWSSDAPKCKLVQCSIPWVRHARKISGTSGPYNLNSAVRFMCDYNYKLKGSDIIKCNQNSEWEPEPPKCLGICRNVPVLPFAELKEHPTENLFLEGETLNYTCKKGFEEVPGENAITTCQGTKWTYNIFCTPVSCGDPGSIDNGYLKRGSFYFDNAVTYECNLGYKMKEVKYRMCQANGSWSLPIPSCEVQTCPTPQATPGTSIAPEKSQYQYGDKLTYSCKKGYMIDGKSQSVCNENGRWSPDLPVCRSICNTPPELEGANPIYHLHKQTFLEGSKVFYNCKPGYTAIKVEKNVTCLGNFEWSHPEQFCAPISCKAPEEIPNAVYKVKDFLFGSEVVYTCNKGFRMQGINSRKCTVDQMWSNPVPKCEVQTCSPPEDLTDGSYSKQKLYYNYQDLVTYSCYNLTLVGEATVSCTAEGTWTSGAPSCKAVCKSPPKLTYGELEENVQHQYFNIGASLAYKCRPGYVAENKSNIITCLEDLRWSTPEVFCKRLSCKPPGDIANGVMHSENFLFESRVNYTCNAGYTMISKTDHRYCQADGTWSGTPPVCKASICENIWELQEEARKCTSTPDEWIKYLQVQYLYLQIENLKLDIDIKKRKLSAEKETVTD